MMMALLVAQPFLFELFYERPLLGKLPFEIILRHTKHMSIYTV